jgi:protein AFG1
MMMDMFYEHVTRPKLKKRIHFHSFMLDIHSRLHKYRQQAIKEGIKESDPLPKIAREIVATEAQLLCLDEFQVTDVADAMILKHLFESLFAAGCTIVCTSNRNPDDLYLGGINRDSFLPFIPSLKNHCQIIAMEKMLDYRMMGQSQTITKFCFM